MDRRLKRAILAVAGSGKTTLLVNSVSLDKRCLLLTYTDNNADNIRTAIIQRFGCVPDNVMVSTWFSFVLNFLVKPFRVENCPPIRWMLFPKPNEVPRFARDIARFVSQEGGIYHCRSFEFVKQYIGENRILNRISRFFDEVFIDEMQDFGGYDFDFIEMLGRAGFSVTLTGDFFQHTYDTSHDGNKNKFLHSDLEKFRKQVGKHYEVDEISLAESHRCPPEVCQFITDKLGISIKSACPACGSAPMLLESKADADAVVANDSIQKLFYNNAHKYNCNALNWGACKGLSFQGVCVVLNNKTYKLYKQDRLLELEPITKNKFYVACSRTRGQLIFVPDTLV